MHFKTISIKKYLVLDDSQTVINAVISSLIKSGINEKEIVIANDLKTAKRILESRLSLTTIITDNDLTKSDKTSSFRWISHKVDGFTLLLWLAIKQRQGELHNIKRITIHSTAFNEGDNLRIIATAIAALVVYIANNITDDSISFSFQPKVKLTSSQ